MKTALELPTTRFGTSSSQILSFPSIRLGRGEMLQVEGPNGSGKTTLMRALFANFATTSPSEALLLPQNYSSLLFPYKPVWWNIALPDVLDAPHSTRTVLLADALATLAHFEVDIDVHKYSSQLSGGEQHVVAIARFARASHQILFLDEPTTGLDRKNSARFWDLVRILVIDRGKFIILVTHDVDVPTREAEYVDINGTNGKSIRIRKESFK